MKPMTNFEIVSLEDNGESPSEPPLEALVKQEPDNHSIPTVLADKITPETFEEWYREREFTENIRDGKPYFNGAGRIKPPTEHSPSSILQCHRKIAYRQLNAPEEDGDPLGIFWSGTLFEEELIQPYLDDTFAPSDWYVTNSIWVNFVIDHDDESYRVKGVTDPVIVDEDGTPNLVTEVKSKRSVENVTEPDVHHKAQAHCYMFGLSEKYDRPITDAVILYGSRTSLEIKPFHIRFDIDFWEDEVVDWISTHSRYRTRGILPPADPELDWECRYCSFKHRCGKSDRLYDNVGPFGLLPKFTEYPKEKVREYLEAHPGAKLTPSLAYTYPDLAEEYPTYDWECHRCDGRFSWASVRFDPADPCGPTCPECDPRGLRGPDPADQNPVKGGRLDD